VLRDAKRLHILFVRKISYGLLRKRYLILHSFKGFGQRKMGFDESAPHAVFVRDGKLRNLPMAFFSAFGLSFVEPNLEGSFADTDFQMNFVV
jgi:hypothetical protein